MGTTADTVIAGVVHTAKGSFERGAVFIRDGVITEVRTGALSDTGSARLIDVGESYVLPGVVDAHVHSYSHAGEGLRASTSAAAAGGVTTIVEMPFDATGPINNVERLKAKLHKVADEAVVDVALLGTLEPGGGWRRAEELVGAGVVGFKVSLFDTDPIRFPRITDAELLDVMKAVADNGSTLCTHAENNEIIKALLADERRRTSTDPRVHAATRPPVSETLGVLTAMEIAAHQGTALHLCHLSLGRSTELVSWYQGQGVDITFETCPHYLLLTEEDMVAAGGRLKINPPLREATNQEAMWRAVTTGLATVISSDHAPWPADLKDHERILDNHSGVPGTETMVATTLGACLRRYGAGPELARTVEALTSAPADRYGIGHRKGKLAPGYDADVTVLTPTEDWRIDGSALHSNAGWSPYNEHLPGARVTLTVSRGDVVWDAAAGLTAAPGRGRQVLRR
ncbi:amidohydrolase family protein [Allokutzneria sp. A3M-2-11 16]|uniref:dihydroorotase n=1 Tax=Allokutzneria sp. A3M-2-11 16 TaxID=2962043 RepID=UPI0020B8FF17|nr:amidohydrolase family protein [Allokutzneria sp. A3M-2-11 16]MCP3804981.1 amidohydrolase family protein [Allokutzneria sp. A3M-2-11 16]